MTRVLKFFNASSRERSILIRSFIWVTLYRIGLWILPFAVTKEWTLGYVSPASKIFDEQLIREIVRAVRIASDYTPYASCLPQALAARKLLEDYGQSSELKIGVSKNEGNFEAHAWLEIDGRIVIGRERMHSRYAVLGSNQTVLR